MDRLSQRAIFPLVAVGVALSWIGAAVAAGPVSITQDKAIAGGISSGDGPGFPILITDPGSYRLDSDLYAADGPHGFFISSPNVTMDLVVFVFTAGPQGPVATNQWMESSALSPASSSKTVQSPDFGALGFYIR